MNESVFAGYAGDDSLNVDAGAAVAAVIGAELSYLVKKTVSIGHWK